MNTSRTLQINKDNWKQAAENGMNMSDAASRAISKALILKGLYKANKKNIADFNSIIRSAKNI